jgi:hypothetical protein
MRAGIAAWFRRSSWRSELQETRIIAASHRLSTSDKPPSIKLSCFTLETCIGLKPTVERQLVQAIAGYWRLVWIDGTYDIAGGQELEKFRRESEVAFGPVDTVK